MWLIQFLCLSRIVSIGDLCSRTIVSTWSFVICFVSWSFLSSARSASQMLPVLWCHHFWWSTSLTHIKLCSRLKLSPFVSWGLSRAFLWAVLLFCWVLPLPLQFASEFLLNMVHFQWLYFLSSEILSCSNSISVLWLSSVCDCSWKSPLSLSFLHLFSFHILQKFPLVSPSYFVDLPLSLLPSRDHLQTYWLDQFSSCQQLSLLGLHSSIPRCGCWTEEVIMDIFVLFLCQWCQVCNFGVTTVYSGFKGLIHVKISNEPSVSVIDSLERASVWHSPFGHRLSRSPRSKQTSWPTSMLLPPSFLKVAVASLVPRLFLNPNWSSVRKLIALVFASILFCRTFKSIFEAWQIRLIVLKSSRLVAFCFFSNGIIMNWRKSVDQIPLAYIYTVFQKKEATKLLAITFSNLNRFSNFFHCWKEDEISNKIS